MNTIIVPVDFSVASIHAARYAAQMTVGHYGINLILYHSYSKSSEEAGVEGDLEKLKQELMHDNIVKIDLMAQREVDFVDGLERAVRHRRADLVVMGIAGESSHEEDHYGHQALKLARTKACPVLIVPEKHSYVPISNVMLTSDFKNTLHTTPSVPIKIFLDLFKPKLHVVNVDKDHYISLTDHIEKEKNDLRSLFEEYDPEFYFMRLYDVEEALSLFAKDRNIDLIIAIQKDHNFMERLFKTSHTKKLTSESNLPVLVIHE